LLTDKDRLSVEDFMNMQSDVYSLWAQELAPFLTRLKVDNAQLGQAIEYIRAWDFRMDKSSVAATVFHVWYMMLARNILMEKLGPDLYEHYFMKQLGFTEHHFLAILQVLEYHDSYWLGSGPLPNLEKRDKLVLLSLEQALKELTEILGSDMSSWRWGRLHTAAFRHRLGIAPPLDQVLNAEPVEVGGDWSTVNRGVFDYSGGFGSLVVASYRQIVDLGNLSNSVAMHSPGQSGQPASEHYRDFIEPWADVRYHPMLFDRTEIEMQVKELLKLTPA
jgi:penicillin amidase